MADSSNTKAMVSLLEEAQDVGFSYAVFEIHREDGAKQPQRFDFFDTLGYAEAHQELLAARSEDSTVYCWTIDRVLEHLQTNHSLKPIKTMNLNNLEDLKEGMTKLGFSEKSIQQMEENMRNDLPSFRLHETIPAARGQVDLTLHFKQSNQSDFYYFNKFEAAHMKGKPLEEGQKYMVITPNEDGKSNMVKKMGNVTEAIDFFKAQKGNSELAVGKDAAHKTMLASMENGSINYVNKDFKGTFYGKPISQTFWVERGEGFTAEQASNLVQGRAVYKDNLVNRGGEQFKAWNELDIDAGRDKYGNFKFKQFNDPAYGFDLKDTLEKFNIKELADPKKQEALENSLRNGNRALVTVEKDGQSQKVFIETIPRFRNMNLFDETGAAVKREQYQKQQPAQTQSKNQGKEMAAAQEMSM